MTAVRHNLRHQASTLKFKKHHLQHGSSWSHAEDHRACTPTPDTCSASTTLLGVVSHPPRSGGGCRGSGQRLGMPIAWGVPHGAGVRGRRLWDAYIPQEVPGFHWSPAARKKFSRGLQFGGSARAAHLSNCIWWCFSWRKPFVFSRDIAAVPLDLRWQLSLVRELFWRKQIAILEELEGLPLAFELPPSWAEELSKTPPPPAKEIQPRLAALLLMWHRLWEHRGRKQQVFT